MLFPVVAAIILLSETASSSPTSEMCARDWPDNFLMQEQCLISQGKAAREVRSYMDLLERTPALFEAFRQCSMDWTDSYGARDYVMISSCMKMQTEAYQRLNPE